MSFDRAGPIPDRRGHERHSLHLAQSFDEVADLYDANRPGYPEAVFVDLMAEARLGPEDAILELGCGTGQATRGLAPFGRRVLAIDPGPELVGVARRWLEGFPHVHFAVSTFEDWAPRLSAYRLIVSAQAFHWIDPGVALPKAAAVLAPGGVLACFAHVPEPPPAAFLGAFEPIYGGWRRSCGSIRRSAGTGPTAPSRRAWRRVGCSEPLSIGFTRRRGATRRRASWTTCARGRTIGRWGSSGWTPCWRRWATR
uniref:Class I SAM-dependent methyltransferase n=1 Tax=Phenylobacterium glaciei TaxID=2803784 RepID=A0A974S969_9CAUL|nr:class I SAM-dependent methyltransferase [Phenylobacterium glaciei]